MYRKRFKAANLRRADPIQHDARPSYVYRWYTAHSYHISALGKDVYERLGRIAAGRAATITPRWSHDWLALHAAASPMQTEESHEHSSAQ